MREVEREKMWHSGIKFVSTVQRARFGAIMLKLYTGIAFDTVHIVYPGTLDSQGLDRNSFDTRRDRNINAWLTVDSDDLPSSAG